MGVSENGSLGLTKKSILERLDTLIELNQKIYETNLVDKFASVVAEVEAKRISTENSLKEFATNVAKVEASLAAEKVKAIIPATIAITDIATAEAVKEAGKVKTEISAELITTVTDEVTKQLADQPIII